LIDREAERPTKRPSAPAGSNILVNNAAIFDMAPLLDVTPQNFERLFQVNVESVFFVLQAVTRLMVRDGRSGCIINIVGRGDCSSDRYERQA
jgi:NAD(P)-dependent dehydrogenase (short-subunit alcohol dehydrogenase family)